MLLRYGADHKDVTGTLIRANCKAMQIEAGIKGPMFQFPINIAPCLTDMWLKQSWFLCWQLRIDLATGTEDFPPKTVKSWESSYKQESMDKNSKYSMDVECFYKSFLSQTYAQAPEHISAHLTGWTSQPQVGKSTAGCEWQNQTNTNGKCGNKP